MTAVGTPGAVLAKRGRSATLVMTVLVLGLLLAVGVDLLLGRGVSVLRVLPALLDPDSTDGRILLLVRLPRVATAVIAGAALGVAGLVLQTVLRNPLASPELTGVNTAAVLGVVVAIAFALAPADSSVGLLLAALIAGLAGGLAVWLLVGRTDPEQQLLAGVLMAAAAGGGVLLFLALRSSRFASVVRWLVGSVDGRVWSDLQWVGPWIAGWIVLLALAGGVLPVLAGGDAHAHALGLPPPVTRLLLLGGALALVAGSAAVAGALTFIGLAVPHLVRVLLGELGRWSVPAAALVGAALLCLCDALAQLVTGLLIGAAVSERVGIPAGAVAAVAGAVTLVLSLRRQDRP